MRSEIKRTVLLMVCAAILTGCAGGSAGKSSEGSSGDKASSSVSSKTDKKDDEGGSKEEKDGGEPADYVPISAEVKLSQTSGFYDSDFDLTITAGEGYEIYYTTDGSVPTKDSLAYTGPVSLTDRTDFPNVLAEERNITADSYYPPSGSVLKGNVIRAAAFDDKGGRGPVSSATYFIGIDREKEFGDVPVISLMMNMDDLFDYETGIYVLGKTYDDWVAEDKKNADLQGWQKKGNYSNRGRDWEKDVYVEYICNDNSVGFAQDMGVRIMGAASRNSPQKSLRLTARKEYGNKSVEYEVIPDNERSDGTGNVTEYKSFVLRNGGNDYDRAKFRDPYLQSMVSDLTFDTLQFAPCVAFIDGEYWGMYCITEDYSDNYIQYNYGIDKDNVVMIKCGEIEEGEDADYELYSQMYEFITGNDMSDPENYAKACEMLDMECFVDYCAFNIYINNEDSIFENNNWRMWRVRTPEDSSPKADGRWRMLCYDVDYSTGIYSGGTNYNDNTISKALKKSSKVTEDNQPASELFRALAENEDFKALLVNAFCDMRNISFEKGHAVEELKKLTSKYSAIVKSNIKRFGPSWANYGGEVKALQTFLEGRYDVFLYSVTDSLKPGSRADLTVSRQGEGSVIMNRTPLDLTEDFSGKYYQAYPVTVTAVPGEGSTFVKWEAEGCELSSETDPTVTVTLGDHSRLTAVFS